MTDDIVAELDRWLAEGRRYNPAFATAEMQLIQRARDEIVALREWKNEHPYSEVDMEMGCNAAAAARILEYQNIARANTLEEAALVCDGLANTRFYDRPYTAYYEECAAAIRALR